MKKKDVLIMCQFFYPEYVTSSTLALELAEDLVEAGLTVDALCGYPNEYYKGIKLSNNEVYKGINIRRVKYVQKSRKSIIGRIINQFSFVFSAALRWHYMLKHRCVIVYSSPPLLPLLPALANYLLGTKFIFVAYDIYPDVALLFDTIKKRSAIDRVMCFTNKLVYKCASKVVVLGNEMKDYLLNNGFTKTPEQIEVIPNWYKDKEELLCGEIKNQEIANIKSDNKFVVLYSGNMGVCQDMRTIMDCAYLLRDNPNILFVFCGHGNKVDEIKSFINDKKIKNVIFYGFLLGSDYNDIMKLADCGIVSLEKGVEGLAVPSKTYSYLSAGKTTIAIMSKETDIAKMLKKYDSGITVEQGNAEGLAKAIEFLASNPEKCKVMSKNARTAFLENYERNISTKKYIELIKSIINED